MVPRRGGQGEDRLVVPVRVVDDKEALHQTLDAVELDIVLPFYRRHLLGVIPFHEPVLPAHKLGVVVDFERHVFVERERQAERVVALQLHLLRRVVVAGNLCLRHAVAAVYRDHLIPVMVEEFFVKVGDAIKAGDPLAKISGEAIQKQLEDLNEQLTKANMALEQAKNAKELNILNNEKSWNQVTQSSQEQYNSEKSVVESELKKLDEQLANIQTKKHEITQKINELEVTQVQANNEAPDLEEKGTNPEILLNSDEELQQLR